jgi:site-specific recombinase XerD
MIQRKVPVTVVQKLLGHASVNTTLIYAKMLDTDVKDSHTRTVV